MTQHHPGLAGRWHTLERSRQVLNLVSELHRAQRWLGSHPENLRLSLERAIELIDYCVADRKQWQGARLRELLRLRETLALIYVGPADAAGLHLSIRSTVLLDAGAAAAFPAALISATSARSVSTPDRLQPRT